MLPAAILAGGLATRLRPLTEVTPKSLILIHGEPFIAHQLRLVRNRGVERVVLCVGFLGEKIREFVSNGRRRCILPFPEIGSHDDLSERREVGC